MHSFKVEKIELGHFIVGLFIQNPIQFLPFLCWFAYSITENDVKGLLMLNYKLHDRNCW